MGDFEVPIQVGMESPVEYHPVNVLNLTLDRYESPTTLLALNRQIAVVRSYLGKIIVICGSRINLFWSFIPVREQCLAGSLTGAVAS